MKGAVAAALALGLAGCGGGKDAGPAGMSLPLGIYAVAAPYCVSTHAPPRYPSPSYKLALFDLDALTAHTMTVAKDFATETLADADCTLTVTRAIYRNYAGEFTLRADRVHHFAPDGCTLAATVDEHAYPVGRAFTAALEDAAARDPETPFVVSRPAPTTYELASVDRADYDEVWAAFGCEKPDRIVVDYVAN